jgi:hypothetical protein
MNKIKSHCRSISFFVLLLLLVVVGAEAREKVDPEGEATVEHHNSIYSTRILTLIDQAESLPPLFPFRWKDYLGYGVAIFGLLLAAGGGVILVPTYILLLDYPVKLAISFASVTVFGGAIANNLLNARKKHPDHSERSVIDWELILQLMPCPFSGLLLVLS